MLELIPHFRCGAGMTGMSTLRLFAKASMPDVRKKENGIFAS